MNKFKTFLKLLFHKHTYKSNEPRRYNVMRADGSKEGEVTLTILDCTYPGCEHSTVIISDRTHTAKLETNGIRNA